MSGRHLCARSSAADGHAGGYRLAVVGRGPDLAQGAHRGRWPRSVGGPDLYRIGFFQLPLLFTRGSRASQFLSAAQLPAAFLHPAGGGLPLQGLGIRQGHPDQTFLQP